MRPSISRIPLVTIATAIAAVCALAVAPTASAATASYSISKVTLGNGKTVVQRWNPCQRITYKVNLVSVPSASRTTILAETHAAIRVLAAKTGLVYIYRGATTEVPRVGSTAKQSAELIIAYVTPAKTNYNLSGSVVGQGGTSSSSWSIPSATGTTYASAITRGFVVFDTPDLLRLLKPGFGTGVRRGNVLLHELAHTAGLGHVSNIHLLMNPAVNVSTPNGYATGDAAGLAVLGSRGGCIPIPTFVAADFR